MRPGLVSKATAAATPAATFHATKRKFPRSFPRPFQTEFFPPTHARFFHVFFQSRTRALFLTKERRAKKGKFDDDTGVQRRVALAPRRALCACSRARSRALLCRSLRRGARRRGAASVSVSCARAAQAAQLCLVSGASASFAAARQERLSLCADSRAAAARARGSRRSGRQPVSSAASPEAVHSPRSRPTRTRSASKPTPPHNS